MKQIRLTAIAAAVCGALTLAACGGGGGDAAPTDGPTATAPSIATQPAPARVTAGQTATFSVSATGSGLSYQWRLNGSNIPGATNASYTTDALTTAASGSSYSVVVTNSSGTATSTAAALTVDAVASALGDNQATANELAREAAEALDAAERRAQVPGGVVVTTQCGGGGSYTSDFGGLAGTGTVYSVTYNNCQLLPGYTYDGSYQVTYSSFADISNFSWTATYNLRFTGPDLSYTYAGTQSCTSSAGNLSCTYFDGQRTFGSSFTYTAGTINGSYSWAASSGGTLSYSFSNFTASSGTITVTGSGEAAGFSAVVTRTGRNTFSVVINGGTPWIVTVGG